MSWLSNALNNAAGWGGEDPEAIRQRQAAQAAAVAKAQADAAAAAQAEQTAQVAASNPVPPPYAGPTGREKLEALLPPGFDTTALPATYGDPFVESSMTAGRGTANDFISNMLKRGTLTGSGETGARSALAAQDPGVRSKLSGISNTLLENERAKLRGIAGEGYTAASAPGETGESFNPDPYYGRTQSELAQFQSAFPASYTTAVGDTGGLYDLNALAGGSVQGPKNLQIDPGTAGGSTGVEDTPPPTKKKRTTSVF